MDPARQVLKLLLICGLTLAAAETWKFPTDEETCAFVQKLNARCPISIDPANEPLFTDSRLQTALSQCETPAFNAHALQISFVTFATLTPRCGILFDEPAQIPDDVIVEAIARLLSWPVAIPTMNCRQVRFLLEYMVKNPQRFASSMDDISVMLKTLETSHLKEILSVLPASLCLFAKLTNIPLYESSQVPDIVDDLTKDCFSGTILSYKAQCSWKDNPSSLIKANQYAKGAGQSLTNSACAPLDAGEPCLINAECLSLLCHLDYAERGCNSSCVRVDNSLTCSKPVRNTTISKCLGTQEEVTSVPLPPVYAGVEELSDVTCCLLRRPRDALRYPASVLCELPPPTDPDCLRTFTRWQVTHAPRCQDCNGTSHMAALLSPECQPDAIKFYPTTIEEVDALIRVTDGRNVMLKMFWHLSQSLDMPLVDIVCKKPLMRVVNVEKFKSLGPEQLEPVIDAMAACEEPPSVAQVLAVLVRGGVCPITLLKTTGKHLIRIGAITDKCLDTMKAKDALKVCSILMMDKAPKLHPSKMARLCKALGKQPAPTTCIFCDNSAALGESPSPPAVKVDRCVALRSLTRSSLSRVQREELEDCTPCQGTPRSGLSILDTSWCVKMVTKNRSDVELVLGSFCEIIEQRNDCMPLECFIKRALSIVPDRQSDSSYSVLRYLDIFRNPGPNKENMVFPCLRSRRMCRVVRELYKTHLVGSTGGCRTEDVITAFQGLGAGSSLVGVLDEEDLGCLYPDIARNLIAARSLNLEEWSPKQAKVLLTKTMQSLGKEDVSELTADEVRELGLILLGMTPEELRELKDIDPPTYGILGSSTLWTANQTRVLVVKYLAMEDVKADNLSVGDLLTLQNLLSGFTPHEADKFPTQAVKKASAVLGTLRLCDRDLVKVLINHLKEAHGPPSSWDESQLAEYSYLLGGLSVEEWNDLGSTIVTYIPDYVWLHNVDETMYQALSEEIKAVITEHQRALARASVMCEVPFSDEPVSDVVSGGVRQVMGLWSLFFCLLLLRVL